MSKVLVIGASGQLGSVVLDHYYRDRVGMCGFFLLGKLHSEHAPGNTNGMRV